jgi:HSP20 family protein
MAKSKNVEIKQGEEPKAQKSAGTSAGTSDAPPPAARQSPFGLLRHEIDRLFDDFSWPDFSLSSGRDRAMAIPPALRNVMRAGAPAMDLVERADEYEVQLELPGLTAGDIDIRMTDGTLAIKGEKTAEHVENEESYHLSERSYGAFQRAFRLPPGIAAEKVEAKFENGVLKVRLPKTEVARESERKIEVKAG